MPSIVYTVNDDIFSQTIKDSRSIRDALIKLNLNETGSAYRVFKKRIKHLGLDISHFVGQAHLRGKTHNWATKIPLKQILISNSSYNNTSTLKRRLLKEGLLENKCHECNLGPCWNGKPITLQLDHINGQYNDNRIINLRILCPNCHSQTETFAGRNQDGAKDRI